MILGRIRMLRRTRELVDLVRDLRKVERAEVLIESGPIDVPWDVPVAIDDQPTERQHAPSYALGG